MPTNKPVGILVLSLRHDLGGSLRKVLSMSDLAMV